RGGATELTFDMARGTIESWSYAGRPFVLVGPRLSLWRAAIDNDARGGGARVVHEWRERFLHMVRHRLDSFAWEQIDDAVARVPVASRVAPRVSQAGFGCRYIYTVFGGGDVLLEVQGTPHGDWPAMLPRVGLELTLPGAFDQVTWLGRGPGESYADSKQAA